MQTLLRFSPRTKSFGVSGRRAYSIRPVVLPLIEGDPHPNIPGATHLLSILQRSNPTQALPSKAVIGWFKKPVQDTTNYQIDHTNFSENYQMEELIQSVLKGHVTNSPTWIERAEKLSNGWMSVLDKRARFERAASSEDILGCVELQEGKMVEGTYTPMPTHRLTSPDGIFKLDDFLADKLLEEVHKA